MKEIKNNIYMLKYIWGIRKSYIIITLILGIIGSASPVIMNLMIKEALDIFTFSENFNNFLRLLILYSSYSLILSIFSNYYNTIYSRFLIEDINEKILDDLYNKSRQIDLLEYDNHEFYNKYNFVLSNALDKAYNSVNIFSNLIAGLFGIGFLITLILTIDPVMVIFALVASIINFIINLKQSKLSYQIEKEINPSYRKINYVGRIYYLKEFAKDLRITKVHRPLSDLYKKGKKGIVDVVKTRGKTQVFYSSLQNIIQIGAMAGIMVYLSKSLMNNNLTAGEFAAVFNSYSQLSGNIERILGFFPQLYKNSLYIEDFKEFLEYENEDFEEKIQLKDYKEIELSHVYFSYEANKEILKDINIKIRKGEKIALVGKNGAGKSTIANIIQGYFQPTKGEIYLNNIAYKKYDKDSISKKIGSLAQDFKTYSLTILENIFMDSKENISKTEIEDAKKVLKDLGLKEKIEKLPKALDTNITSELEEGVNFSGGELQKIALARVLIKDYELIILDEPSSALDAYSEKEIFEKILNKYSNESIILISHKLANVINVDRIYYIEDGQIVEEGSHKDLMDLGGYYKELFEIQAKNYIKSESRN
ncbi:ABC transporter ATP-binding protein [Neofamilia massiliensis]|uniref:ABC transporter ATP-binding protein n=1 Tax=Neofamilia massiliensis TaxID=1673724 RepID=UPI0006BB73D1|nr:ABC transporter ATP-binding protein [Neofamilia massiliensis]